MGAIPTTRGGVEDAVLPPSDNLERTTIPAACDDLVLNGWLSARTDVVECLPFLGRMSLGQQMEIFKLARKGVAEAAFCSELRSEDADAEVSTRAYMCKLEILNHTVRALFHYPSVSEAQHRSRKAGLPDWRHHIRCANWLWEEHDLPGTLPTHWASLSRLFL